MIVIDLFCGCGGFSQGFEEHGFDVLGIDMWDVCLQSHGGNTLQFDIGELSKQSLPTEFQNPDIVIGSPPCQTFSTANRDTRTKDDTLIKHFQRIVSELKPKYWVWENVMGSRCVEEGTVLDAQNFGVAQRRKRNFVANFHLRNILEYKQPSVTMRQVLPRIKGTGILDGYNSTVYSLDSVSPTVRRIPLKWYDDFHGACNEKGKLKSPYDTRLRFTGFDMLSTEDHLTLMGFNRDKKIYGNKGDIMIQIGNAVSPAVSKAVAQYLQMLEGGI